MECIVCGAETDISPVGRPRLYCSPACKQRAYRSRNWEETPRRSGALTKRASALACELAGKAACVHALLNHSDPALAALSASDLAHAALEHARELLQVLELPARQRTTQATGNGTSLP